MDNLFGIFKKRNKKLSAEELFTRLAVQWRLKPVKNGKSYGVRLYGPLHSDSYIEFSFEINEQIFQIKSHFFKGQFAPLDSEVEEYFHAQDIHKFSKESLKILERNALITKQPSHVVKEYFKTG